jgi:hypothetical protein
MARKLVAAALTLLGLWIVLCALAYAAMSQPPDVFGRTMARVPMVMAMVVPFQTLWVRARAGHLAVGDPAPDFELPGKDLPTPLRLSSFRGKQAVVLIFGSYT